MRSIAAGRTDERSWEVGSVQRKKLFGSDRWHGVVGDGMSIVDVGGVSHGSPRGRE